MKTLTFEVSDALYAAFQQMAAKSGRTLEEVALEWLAKYAPQSRPQLTVEEHQEAWGRLLSTRQDCCAITTATNASTRML